MGWCIIIDRQSDGESSPPTADSVPGQRVALWRAGWQGLNWLNDLVKAGHAVKLGGIGYPTRYAVTVEWAREILERLPKDGGFIPASDPLLGTARDAEVNEEALNAATPADWLLVTAWDQS